MYREFQGRGAQAAALEYRKQHGGTLFARAVRRAYAFIIADGTRTIFDRMETLPRREWTFHEVLVPEARVWLYVDAEFARGPDVDRDPVTAVRLLITRLAEFSATLRDELGFVLEPADVLVYDATTARKASFHLVWRTPQPARNNFEVGAFMRRFVLWNVQHCGGDLMVNGEPFVDLGVYTRNRQFRMPLNTKAGQRRPLVPLGEAFAFLDVTDRKTLRKVFERGLVIAYGHAGHTWAVQDFNGAGARSSSLQYEALRGGGRSVSRVSSRAGSRSQSGDDSTAGAQAGSTVPVTLAELPDGVRDAVERVLVELTKRGIDEPTPWLGGAPGTVTIRTRTLDCPVLGREHKSNHIFFVVRFTRQPGVFRGCYDHECQRKLRARGGLAAVQMPRDVMAAIVDATACARRSACAPTASELLREAAADQ
jgi:hypothetical protein